MPTIRDQISEVLSKINFGFKTLTKEECAEYANVLASLLSTVLEKEAEMEGIANMYKVTLIQSDEAKSVGEADAMMRASKEWLDFRKTRALRIGMEETIRTLKRRIDVLLDNQREFTP